MEEFSAIGSTTGVHMYMDIENKISEDQQYVVTNLTWCVVFYTF